ncbi:MAG: hypothetical protein KBD63_07110 [Bacteriovoracaceae bacterium]|nr:hypothetical protein [Bacteriovoracaceae bacterium]
MDTFQAILNDLGADISVLYQMALVFLLFLLLKILFFSKLQFVLENREEKTAKLQDKAHHHLQQVETLSQEYKKKMDAVYAQAQTMLAENRKNITTQQAQKVREVEAQEELFFEAQKRVISEDVKKEKENNFKQAQDLAKNLVAKIIN